MDSRGAIRKSKPKIPPKRVKEIRHPKENDWSSIGGKERKVNAEDSKKKVSTSICFTCGHHEGVLFVGNKMIWMFCRRW